MNQEKLLFSVLSPSVDFGESLHEISLESYLYKKLFGRAPRASFRQNPEEAQPNSFFRKKCF